MKSEAYDFKDEVMDPYPWKHMIFIKRYKYHSLYEKLNMNGSSYRMCFLNIEIDREKKMRGKL